ncbi:gliding motility-associated C-terminal domain-containing protein [Urechidicola croceus]|uniref:CARDB domain-containing protein n=1 Tax=Urechidicola croceus TaxID=1850246 RepID=A0A1D8P3Z6_9FLAO|nr:gliding motility-associated C-terminal domain-containing protein [Urechidicola croceus]AOW19241.1 hypothetical protein LPB138_00425 [Urechidicola croceus]
MKKHYFYILIILSIISMNGQNVELVNQFGGRIDFTMIGNTLNTQENGLFAPCSINTESSTELELETTNNIIAAYLYWAGSGTGDFDVKLNGTDISATRRYDDIQESQNLSFFSAYAEVTELIQNNGNTTYTLSDLDLTDVIADYCPNGTNFAGWAILIIYENDSLPLNQINIYEGLQHVPDELNIELDQLNVIDNDGAKIGFLAWEGDAGISINESLRINGNLIGNPPLNPNNNAFNGTNSFTNESNLYNMDLDFYNIQNNIDIGDTDLNIQLTSSQDFVMINTVVTKLNSQLPDATIVIDEFEIENCNERETLLSFSVYNSNSTEVLPSNTPINIYINELLIATTFTSTSIQIDDFESFELNFVIPESELQEFTITTVVNENNDVLEIDSNNNTDFLVVNFPLPPVSVQPNNMETCNIGFGTGIFDLGAVYDTLSNSLDEDTELFFYPSEEDFLNNTNEINTAFEYTSLYNPQTIYIKTENTNTSCFSFTTFELTVYNCPPTIPDGFSPDGDSINDTFFIDGLYDIFIDFDLKIYNRYGNLVYEGNQQTQEWNGRLNNTKELVPTGVYFYVLYPNNIDYKTVQGRLYVSR